MPDFFWFLVVHLLRSRPVSTNNWITRYHRSWDYQIGNSMLLNLALEHRWRLTTIGQPYEHWFLVVCGGNRLPSTSFGEWIEPRKRRRGTATTPRRSGETTWSGLSAHPMDEQCFQSNRLSSRGVVAAWRFNRVF
jgi:hypothetical protein